MSVIVDPIRRYEHIRLAVKDWCHLAVDGQFEELHAFAATLGIPRHRFQGDHYDLPPWLRARAVQLGAEEVTTADLLVRMAGPRGDRARRRAARRPRAVRSHAMTEQPYFDAAGEPSDAAGRFVRPTDDVAPLELIPGLRFQPVTTDSVMTNFVTFAPSTEAAMHHHFEQQIAIVVSGELTFTVGTETRVMGPGDLVVIPPHVPHGGVSGPEGCVAIDVFTPPRDGIVRAME
jgi:unsaturated pyranuronate lyase